MRKNLGNTQTQTRGYWVCFKQKAPIRVPSSWWFKVRLLCTHILFSSLPAVILVVLVIARWPSRGQWLPIRGKIKELREASQKDKLMHGRLTSGN